MSDVPEWVIERAKDNAERFGDDREKWGPFIRFTLDELEMYYGWPLPEKDPRRESRRREAVERQRVLDLDRWTDAE